MLISNHKDLAGRILKLFSSAALAMACSFSASAAPEHPTGPGVCSAEVAVKDMYGEGTSSLSLNGICIRNAAGSPIKWIVAPRFKALYYSKESDIFSGWKYNDPADNIDDEETREAAKAYGHTSSVIFNRDGSKRIEFAGKVDVFRNGYAGVLTGPEPRILGFKSAQIRQNHLIKTVATAYLGVDFLLKYVSEWFHEVLLLDSSPYPGIETRMFREQRLGFVDASGRMVIEPKFMPFGSLSGFSPKYAVVANEDRKYGLIDKSGAFVIEPRFRYADFLELNHKQTLAVVESKCGIFVCDETQSFLDPVTLKTIESTTGTRYKYRLLRTLSKDTELKTPGSAQRLAVGAWVGGALLLWPFCLLYQRFRKKASWGKSMVAGLGWCMGLSAATIAGTILVLCLFAMALFGGSMLGTVLAQDRK